MITDNQLSILNKLYWFKDSFEDKETTIEYLKSIQKIAEDLEAEGLVKEITDYLEVLK